LEAQPESAKNGTTVPSVEVKGVRSLADLKRTFGEVLKCQQDGQAALGLAHGERAVLRNPANAARLLEDNPSLMNLRLM
jgi:regulator of protease activity HflC (stomatin/prohibitin superfamily)